MVQGGDFATRPSMSRRVLLSAVVTGFVPRTRSRMHPRSIRQGGADPDVRRLGGSVLQGPPGGRHGAGAWRGEANVNYRHVIVSLVRKPGAFARYRFREQLFPTRHFRLAYDLLREWRGKRADVEYVRILHLAATTMEATVDSALSLLLEAGQPFDYGEVRDLAEPKVPEAPALTLSGQPDLKIYDRLLTGSLVAAGVCA